MTNRERLFRVLDGKPADRVPIWLLFPYHRASYYADVRTNPAYASLFEESKSRCVMLNRRNFSSAPFLPEVKIETREFTEDGWAVKRTEYRYRSEMLYAETRRNAHETRIKKLLSNEDDLLTLSEFPVNLDTDLLMKELDAQLPRYLAERDEFPPEYGSMMLDLGEPISFLYHNSDLTEYPIWSLTRNDEVTALLGRFMEYERIRYRYCLERNLADVYFFVGSELASPPMVSGATFREWIVPYAKELIGLTHESGKKAIQHYHGQIKDILPDFLTMAPDALHTIEAPPIGNCTLTEAFEITGDKIALIGNIQYDDFRALSADEMREAVRGVLREAEGRPFILSPSAGPYEEVITDRMRENYHAFIDEGWNSGARMSRQGSGAVPGTASS